VANLVSFIVDQLLHILVLVVVVVLFQNDLVLIYKMNSIFIAIMILAYLIMPSSILVDKTVSLVGDNQLINGFNLEDEGTLIGVLERILIFAFGLTGNLGGIGFLVTAKTMVRYGQFDKNVSETNGDDENSDYSKNFRSKYLVGTLSSVAIGLFLFIIYQYVVNLT